MKTNTHTAHFCGTYSKRVQRKLDHGSLTHFYKSLKFLLCVDQTEADIIAGALGSFVRKMSVQETFPLTFLSQSLLIFMN